MNNRGELLAIKAGEMDYDVLLELADTLIESIEKHYQTSTLPETPDVEKAIQNLVAIREILYS